MFCFQIYEELQRSSSISTFYVSTEEEKFSKPTRIVQRLRKLSVSECRNVQEMEYYSNGIPDRIAYSIDNMKLPKSFVDPFHHRIRKDNDFSKFHMPWAGHLKFDGRLIPASRLYGCFVTMSSKTIIGLPENFKVSCCHHLNYSTSVASLLSSAASVSSSSSPLSSSLSSTSVS